jgi:hypothetical protein
MSEDLPFFLTQNTGLRAAEAIDDYLHPQRNASIKTDSLTETQYFGFCVPAERIQAFCYLWHHPNLHIVSGGLFVFQGHKPTVVHGELCDFRCFMNDSPLKNDLYEYRLENSYSVKVIEPLKRHHLSYADATRSNSVDLDFRAVQPPVMFGDGNHFEQAMKVTGKLELRGKHHDVDCFTVRDRSWAKSRPEENFPVPTGSWMMGVFNEDFAFGASVFDQKDTALELRGELARPIEKTLVGGWLHRDGRVGRVITAHKRIIRDPKTFLAQYVELAMTDEHGRSIQVRGTSTASTIWQTWANMVLPICQMRWECDGLVAYGECQEGNSNDHFNQLLQQGL